MKKVISYFSHAAERKLAQDMAQRLAKQLAPTLVAKRSKLMSVNKITKLLEQSFEVAKEHQEQRRMGMIKRAVLANNFRWALTDLGYPSDFVEVATEGLVVALAKPDRGAGSGTASS